jgi:hypothetical protein
LDPHGEFPPFIFQLIFSFYWWFLLKEREYYNCWSLSMCALLLSLPPPLSLYIYIQYDIVVTPDGVMYLLTFTILFIYYDRV